MPLHFLHGKKNPLLYELLEPPSTYSSRKTIYICPIEAWPSGYRGKGFKHASKLQKHEESYVKLD